MYPESYQSDPTSSDDPLYISDDPYANIIASSNRLNNRLVRADDGETILEDLCRIFRECKSSHFVLLCSMLIYIICLSMLSAA